MADLGKLIRIHERVPAEAPLWAPQPRPDSRTETAPGTHKGQIVQAHAGRVPAPRLRRHVVGHATAGEPADDRAGADLALVFRKAHWAQEEDAVRVGEIGDGLVLPLVRDPEETGVELA